MAVTARQLANTPMSLGVYNLVITGLTSIVIACAITVPEVNVTTDLKKEFFRKLIFKKINPYCLLLFR
jgi:hypothetical protein